MNDATESRVGHRVDLTAAAPVRALAISAAAAVVAIVLLAVWGATEVLIALILGVAVLIFAVSLALVAVLLTRRLRTSVLLAPDAITVLRGRRQQKLPWSDVEQVDLRGARLSFAVKNGGEDVVVVNPRAASDPVFLSLVAEVRGRLDADRGYGGRPF